MINPFRKKNRNRDLLKSDYFILAIGLSLGFAGYLFLAQNPALQVGVVITTGLFYILWGSLHHAREKDFHLSILLEYILVAALAMTLLITLILRT